MLTLSWLDVCEVHIVDEQLEGLGEVGQREWCEVEAQGCRRLHA